MEGWSVTGKHRMEAGSAGDNVATGMSWIDLRRLRGLKKLRAFYLLSHRAMVRFVPFPNFQQARGVTDGST